MHLQNRNGRLLHHEKNPGSRPQFWRRRNAAGVCLTTDEVEPETRGNGASGGVAETQRDSWLQPKGGTRAERGF